MKTLALSLLTAVALASSAQAGTYHVSLKSVQNGKYVRAGVGPGTLLAAVSPQLGDWEDFELVELGNGQIALRSVQNGKYVRAGVGPSTLLAAVSGHVAGWEIFQKIDLGGNRVALRSVQNGKYVRAGVGPGTLLAAVSDHIAGWETFEMYASSSTPPPPPPPPATELVGTWVSNIHVEYQIKKWADGYMWEAPQLNQVGIVKYSGPINCDSVHCQWWDNQVMAGTGTGTIIRNAQGKPVQINWSNGVIFRRQ